MAYENSNAFVTLPATTGLVQFQLVAINSAGKAANPTLGGRVVGVLVSSGTNTSTEDRYGTVQILGVSKVLAAASTAKAGTTISATSAGRAKNTTGSGFVAGVQVEGSSGAAGRIISVLLTR